MSLHYLAMPVGSVNADLEYYHQADDVCPTCCLLLTPVKAITWQGVRQLAFCSQCRRVTHLECRNTSPTRACPDCVEDP
jgi:hypothetical protein